MNKAYYMYLPLMLLPTWFIILSLNRVRRHRRDGKENYPHLFTIALIVKISLALLMIMLLAIQTISILNHHSIIKAFYVIFCMSWIVSFLMLIIEFLLKLKMNWIGHRGFWIGSLLIWVIIIAISYEEHFNYLMKNIAIPRIVIFSLCAFTNLVLAIFAVIRPNEFRKPMEKLDRLLLKSSSNSFAVGKKTYEKTSFQIKDYKIKVIGEKSVLSYNILVQIGCNVHNVKRTYKEFEDLSKSIRSIFPQSSFPQMRTPELPIFVSKSMTIERKILVLNAYLLEICAIDFFNEYTLDFLGIQGSIRQELLIEHKQLLESEGAAFIESRAETNFVDLTQINFEQEEESVIQPKCKSNCNIKAHFIIKIRSDLQSDGKVEYIIKTKSILGKQKVYRAFKDFNKLHQELKKIIDNDIMPKFPKKSYFRMPSKTDVIALELRKAKLEKYLAHILNDPAYHCQEIFKFIGFIGEFQDIWILNHVKYEIIPPIEWETNINEPEFIIFIINIKKIIKKQECYHLQAKRSYEEFKYLHKFLEKRSKSALLAKYYEFMRQQLPIIFPVLPEKPQALSDIESLRENLEIYLKELCELPLIHEAYALINFLND